MSEVIANCRLPIAELEDSARSLLGSPQLFQSAIDNRQSAITEWYENRAEGIEQGFTIAQRPERNNAIVSGQPLRLVVSLNGDLRAHEKDGGQAIELTDGEGKPVLSYSKLTAVDATGSTLRRTSRRMTAEVTLLWWLMTGKRHIQS